MSKNNIKLGIAGLTAAATGAALFTAKTHLIKQDIDIINVK